MGSVHSSEQGLVSTTQRGDLALMKSMKTGSLVMLWK
jgi:hypothetical protein